MSSSPIPYVPPRQNSVVIETLNPNKNVEMPDLLPSDECKDFVFSPSWYPGMLPGEQMVFHEPCVSMELTNSVQATWLNNTAYFNNETITPKKTGLLIGTNFRLVFVDKTDKPHTFPSTKNINLIPLNTIGNINFLITGKDESTSRTLQLWCKDCRLITLTFETAATCSEMHKKLLGRTVSTIEKVFAFTQNASPRLPETEHVLELEFKRLKLDPAKWRLTKINQDYNKIPSYPATLIVPNDIPDSVLHKAAAFRCNSRIPAVCWVSPTGASISRTSQPHTGIWSARSEDDEMLVRGIFSKNEHYSKRPMYIMDCRPKLSAVGNMAKGLGYEKPEGYSEHTCEIVWMGIDNIHTMRDSLYRMFQLCMGIQSDHKWLSNLEYTRWMDHLSLVLSTAVKAVELVDQGSSILVHCSDGWDRTSQITSLAQVLLSGYYRTFKGFLELIQKEWIAFGHRFQARSGHGCGDFWTNEHCSPIFLQWVDCVWQVMQQFPQCFEFNEKLLIDVLDNLYNCYFGEFLFNNEREMLQAKPFPSLWQRYAQKPNCIFKNPFYHETNQPQVLLPGSSPKILRFWAGYYLRYYQPQEDGLSYIHQKGRELISERDGIVEELKQMKLQLEKEMKLRSQLEQQLHTVANANEKQREEMRRRSFECKVMSEEGEGTVWCKIGMDDMANPPLKRVHIIDDYDPLSLSHSPSHSVASYSTPPDSPCIDLAQPTSSPELDQTLPVSPKRKNSRPVELGVDELPA